MTIRELKIKVRSVDTCSFFVGGKLFTELSKEDIMKHDCFHMINVFKKFKDFLRGKHTKGDATVMINEVIPDLLIYGIQLENAFQSEDVVNVPSVSFKISSRTSEGMTLTEIQMLLKDEFEVRSICELEELFDGLIDATNFMSRIGDKHDHNTLLPHSVIIEEVVPCLIRTSLKLADYFKQVLVVLVEKRLNEIMEKYGDVRLLDLSKPFYNI